MKKCFIVLFTCACIQTFTFGDTTNAPSSAAALPPIKTSFVRDAELSPTEVKQVLKLATLCGIHSPAEVYTYRSLPSTSKYIGVRSVEHVKGRNTTFETVEIFKLGWNNGQPGHGAIQIGNFWARADAKYRTLLRRYDFHQASVQIVIENGVDIAFADKIISLIDAGKVQFRDDLARQGFEELNSKAPESIHKGEANHYELWFAGRILEFEWKD